MSQLLAGVLGAGLVAVAAWRLRALTGDGALAAGAVGAVTYGVGGTAPAVLLIAFFVSSSALSLVGRSEKAGLADRFSKGPRRDWVQVIANGGLAALFAVGLGLDGRAFWLAGVAGALGAATADTWGTELGVLAEGRPRMITSGRQVEAGTSGAITLRGTLASLAGAMFIGALAALLSSHPQVLTAATVGGFSGAVVDSLLGATLQARFYCATCDRQTEQHPNHAKCGQSTRWVGGLLWLDNDTVNLLATLVGGLLGVGLVFWR